MERTFNHLTLEQRKQLREMLDAGCKKPEIAQALNTHVSTVYREIKRGSVNGSYDPNCADEAYQQHLSEQGPEARLSRNPQLAEHIASLILKRKLSPEKIVDELQEYETGSISIQTIYHSIDKGLIPGVTRESLRTDTVTVFSDGQICIPKWGRNLLDIADGDKLHFEVIENKLIFSKES